MFIGGIRPGVSGASAAIDDSVSASDDKPREYVVQDCAITHKGDGKP